MFISFLLAALFPSNPLVKWENLTSTPPKIDFTVSQTDDGYEIKSSDGKSTLTTNYKPIIGDSWQPSLYGNYWTREVMPERRPKDFGGYAFGEIVWYDGKLWPFLPDDRPMRRQVKGISSIGEVIENRSWYDYSTDKIPCEVHFYKQPTIGLNSYRIISSARVSAVTENGAVIGNGTMKQMDYSDDTVHDYTTGDVLIAKNASYGGTCGNSIMITQSEAVPRRRSGQRALWQKNENRKWQKVGDLSGDIEYLSVLPGPRPGVYFKMPTFCIGENSITMWDLIIDGQSISMLNALKDIQFPDDASPLGYLNGKLILGSSSIMSDHPKIYGYLSIEGVTPGFTRDQK